MGSTGIALSAIRNAKLSNVETSVTKNSVVTITKKSWLRRIRSAVWGWRLACQSFHSMRMLSKKRMQLCTQPRQLLQMKNFGRQKNGLEDVLNTQKEDYNHFNDQAQYADAVDASAYPDEREKKAIDDQNYHAEKAEADHATEMAKDDEKESNKEANANESFTQASEATKEADEALGEKDNLMKGLQTDIQAEDETLNAAAGDGSPGGGGENDRPAMTQVSNVAAEVEALGVKVKAAKEEATNSNSK